MRKVCLAALLSALFSAAVAFGQNASVSGTVTDPSGAQVAGASITAANNDTGVVSPSITNRAGVYGIPELPPGTYTLTAAQPGFRKAVVANVILEVGSQLSLNIGLEIGQTSETVEVQATATEVTPPARPSAMWSPGKSCLTCLSQAAAPMAC